MWFKRCLKSRFNPKTSLRSVKNVVFFLFCSLVDRQIGRGGQKPPLLALPGLRYSHRMSKNYLHRTLIFLLSKVYFVQVFIQHTVTNNVINYIPEDILRDVLSNRHTFCAKPHNCIALARSQKFAIGGGCVGGWWSIQPPEANGCGGKAPSRRRHGGLGAEPPALENFACFRKNNFILELF